MLEEVQYSERKARYAEAGQRHYYFMSLSGTEVIDACDRGNMGRFINHSCQPNCETQKWRAAPGPGPCLPRVPHPGGTRRLTRGGAMQDDQRGAVHRVLRHHQHRRKH